MQQNILLQLAVMAISRISTKTTQYTILTNPISLPAYSLLLQSTSSTSTKSPLQVENSTFSGEGMDKNTAQNSLKHAISSKKSIFLRSRHEETRELPGERDSAKNNARCTQARKTTHGLDEQEDGLRISAERTETMRARLATAAVDN